MYGTGVVVLGDNKYNETCDLWSIGVIMLEIMLNDCPLKGQTEKD